MIIINDMAETCSYGIIFEILLIWLYPPHMIAWLYVSRKPACLAAENRSACPRKPDCPPAEICLLVCANLLARLRKPVCVSAQTKPTICVSPARMSVNVSLTRVRPHFRFGSEIWNWSENFVSLGSEKKPDFTWFTSMWNTINLKRKRR
jgi:hypothetical protein